MSDEQPDRYGVIGYPIAHSRSPIIHKLFAMQTNQSMEYDAMKVKPAELESAISSFRRSGGKGLNVTTPHKNKVAKLVDSMSDRARVAGAVNTLVFLEDAMQGDNTDGFGLIRDLEQNLEINLAGARILILGAGGATGGIMSPLLERNPESIVVANRTMNKAKALEAHFGNFGEVTACRFDSVPTEDGYDLMINATSAGLKGEAPPYPDEAVSEDTVCYDLSYALSPTPFCQWAAARGAAQSVMGWGMLVEQAAESFRIWRGIRPDTKPVLDQVRTSGRFKKKAPAGDGE